ncbi:MAG: riboflavin kinase [Patescibacteria group bacterium]
MIRDIVRKGRGYGKKIGYPTININNKSKIKHGVYAGVVRLGKRNYRAGIVIGENAEAYLVGYRGNAYGRTATMEVGKFIRKFKKFKTEKELIAQIKKDLENV